MGLLTTGGPGIFQFFDQISSHADKGLAKLNAVFAKWAAPTSAAPAAVKAFGSKGVMAAVKADIQKWHSLIKELGRAQAKLQKTRLAPTRTSPAAIRRQVAERETYAGLGGAGGPTGKAAIPLGQAGLLSKTFIRLFKDVGTARQALQIFGANLDKSVTKEIGKASSSVIASGLRFRKVEEITRKTFDRLLKAGGVFGIRAVQTAKTRFAKGIIEGNRAFERFFLKIKQTIGKHTGKVGGWFRNLLSGIFPKGGMARGAGGGIAGIGGNILGVLGGAGGALGGAFKAVSGKLAALGKVAGPIVAGAIAGVKFLKKGLLDLPLGIIKKAASFALLPLRVLGKIHRVIQSISFTIFLVWSILSRTLREPLAVMKQVHTAVSIAEGSLKNVGGAMETVMDLAVKMPVPITEIAKGFYEVVRSGFNADEAMTILNASLEFAVTTGGDLARAIDQIIGVLRAFEMDVGKAAEVAKVLHLAVGNSRASLADLQIALGYAGPAAVAAGISFKEATAILTMFRDANIRASRAGMTFRAGLDAIQRAIGVALGGTMTLQKAVKHLGLAWGEMLTEKGALDLRVILSELHTLTQRNLSAMDRMALRAIFQGRHWANWYKLAKMGNEALQKRLRQLNQNVVLEKKSVELSKTLWGLADRLANIWTVFKIKLLREAMPALEKLADFLDGLVDLVENSVQPIGNLIKEVISEPFLDFLEGTLLPIFKGGELETAIKLLVGRVKPVLQDIFKDVEAGVKYILGDIKSGAWTDPIVAGLIMIKALLKGSFTVAKNLYEFFKKNWKWISVTIVKITALVTGVFEILLPIGQVLLRITASLLRTLEIVTGLFLFSNTKIRKLIDDIEGIEKATEKMMEGIQQKTDSALENAKKGIGELANYGEGKAKEALDGIGGTMRNLLDRDVIGRLRKDVEDSLGQAGITHKIELKVTPSRKFEELSDDIGKLMDFEEMKRQAYALRDEWARSAAAANEAMV